MRLQSLWNTVGSEKVELVEGSCFVINTRKFCLSAAGTAEYFPPCFMFFSGVKTRYAMSYLLQVKRDSVMFHKFKTCVSSPGDWHATCLHRAHRLRHNASARRRI